MQRCFGCDGKGTQQGNGLGYKCTTCNGSGQKSISVQPCFCCGGKGTQQGYGLGNQCTACKGKGEKSLLVQACFGCGGKGTQQGYGLGYNCTGCAGSGDKPLNHIACPKCNGKGSAQGYGLGYACETCKGKGSLLDPTVPKLDANIPFSIYAGNTVGASFPGYNLVELIQSSQEYTTVTELLKSQLGKHLKVLRVERIDNPTLRRAFLVKTSKLLDSKSPTTFKFRGAINLNAAVEDGFSLESGNYGPGIYLSDYVKNPQNSEGRIVLCEVAIGKYLTCAHPQPRLNSSILNQYDSIFATSNTMDAQFVFYDKDQVLPRYIVDYSY